MPNARLSVAKTFATSVVKWSCAGTNENLKHNSILNDQHVSTQLRYISRVGNPSPKVLET